MDHAENAQQRPRSRPGGHHEVHRNEPGDDAGAHRRQTGQDHPGRPLPHRQRPGLGHPRLPRPRTQVVGQPAQSAEDDGQPARRTGRPERRRVGRLGQPVDGGVEDEPAPGGPPGTDGEGAVEGVDGALAIGTGRASQRGFVLDSVVDRLTEAAYAAALWAAGAPGWLAVAFGALCWLPDYLRARAGQAGIDRTGPISIWERPTRVAMTGMTLVGAGVLAATGLGTGLATGIATAGAAVGAVLGLVGTAQIGWWLRGVLDGPAGSGGAAGPDRS